VLSLTLLKNLHQANGQSSELGTNGLRIEGDLVLFTLRFLRIRIDRLIIALDGIANSLDGLANTAKIEEITDHHTSDLRKSQR
jgi:hypothetical protein